MVIKVDGKVISREELNRWKDERIVEVLKTLGETLPATGGTDARMEKLTDLKLKLGSDEIAARLKKSLNSCDKLMKFLVKLSGKRRRYSRAVITVEGISAKEAADRVNEINLNAEKNPDYERANLAACPDHYVLREVNGSLEVIETTGNSPSPSRFYITYGDESGLMIPRDTSYPYQSLGVARLRDGTAIGGVRHQFRDTATGFEANLCVEFPGMTPKGYVEQHQMHLATEFSYWLQWIVDHAGK